MKSGTEKKRPQLPCPQCHKVAPADSKTCPACGAEMYVDCPTCGVRRGVEDGFCRQCGFNFSRRKLHLKEADPSVASPPGDSLPKIGFHKSGPQYRYRMSPRMAGIRAFFMLLFLLLIAAVLFFAFNRDWGQAAGALIGEQVARVWPAGAGTTGASPEDAEPDWNARYHYWFGYYRDVFNLPPTNSTVTVTLSNGMTEQGLFMRVAEGSVRLLKDGRPCEFPRLALADDTRRFFFYDDFAKAKARATVLAEKAAWKQKALAPKPDPDSSFFSGLLSSRAAAATSSPPSAAGTFLDIKCPACAGMGYLVVAGGGSLGGPAHSGIGQAGGNFGLKSAAPAKTQSVKQPCPVCDGKGFRRFARLDFPWPAGASRCGNCQGMGNLLAEPGPGPSQGTRCSICDGRGYVLNQYDAARNVPPKYE